MFVAMAETEGDDVKARAITETEAGNGKW